MGTASYPNNLCGGIAYASESRRRGCPELRFHGRKRRSRRIPGRGNPCRADHAISLTIRRPAGHGLHALARLAADLIERSGIEETLRRSEERFRQVAESAGEFIWEVDADGLYVYASP